MKKKKILRLILFLLVFFLILLLTFQNSEKSAELSNRIRYSFHHFHKIAGLYKFWEYNGLPHLRKFAHTAEYFLLGISAMLLFRESPKGFLKAVALCAVISLSDQSIKGFLPGREFDWTDFPYDIAGYALGIVIVLLISRRRTRRRQNDNTE